MFLDIGIGILAALFSGYISDTAITPLFLFLSIGFALFPDIDMVTHGKLKKGYEHRELLHYPLLLIPTGAIIVQLTLGAPYTTAFVIAVSLHFVHDSIGIGRGIKWLYPFSQTAYAFIYLYSRTVKNGLWKIVFRFRTQEDYERFDREHGDENWIKNIYLAWHPFAIFEFIGFIIAIIILIIYVS